MASKMGHKALKLLLQGEAGKALGIKCNEIIHIDLEEALNTEKELDMGMYEMAKILSI